ncbi:MAG: type II toxin-antitoxin system HicB family antitoxin [Rhodanobacter sp.]
MRYPIAIEIGDDKNAYGVVVPDLPGCFSAGDTMDEAISNTEEAILAWMEAEETLTPPRASKVDVLRGLPEYDGWAWAFAAVDLAKLNDKAVRINVTIPERVLHAIDGYAQSQGESRSGFLTRAALEVMHG